MSFNKTATTSKLVHWMETEVTTTTGLTSVQVTVLTFTINSLPDSFQVYQGQIRTLAPFHFANVLRHPSCFYFFSVSALPNVASPDLEDSVVQRDICWLTGTLYSSITYYILHT